MKFVELNFKEQHPDIGGLRAVIKFDNGYGASIVTGGKLSYTKPQCPYEIAVLKGDEICYDTIITRDVLAYQTAKGVARVLNDIASLEEETNES